jgi:hypothetical protein
MAIHVTTCTVLVICSLFSFLFVKEIKSVGVPPTWLTSSYVQADSKKVINGDLCRCTTGNTSTPTATMPFTTAFTNIPNLGYGVSNYQGK